MEQGRRASAHFQEASRAVPLRLRGRNVLVAADQEFQLVQIEQELIVAEEEYVSAFLLGGLFQIRQFRAFAAKL